MEITRKKQELIIKIPDNVLQVEELQDFLDYLRFRTITSTSKAKEADIAEIAEEIDREWWEKNKDRLRRT